MHRRTFMRATLGAMLLARPALAEQSRLEVYKSPTCGCCSAWVDHMRDAGFAVEAQDVTQETLSSLKVQAGLTPELSSCHTAFIDGYVIEGHVPAQDVRRLLAERPDAAGLAVPGMPIGSPGMEMDNQRDVFDTFLLLRGRRPQVFQRHI